MEELRQRVASMRSAHDGAPAATYVHSVMRESS
jgi:hypothetical protein